MLGIALFLLLVTGLIFSLRYKPVQSYFGRMAADFLSNELHARIAIEGLHVVPFSSLHLQSLYISDQQGDTLLYAPEMKANFNIAKILQGQATIYDVELSNAQFNLHVDAQGKNNLSFLIDYFRPKDSSRKRKIAMELERIHLENVAFTYLNQQRLNQDATQPVSAINFNNLEVFDINGTLSDIQFDGPKVQARISAFSLKEHSGFQIKHLEALSTLDEHRIELRELDLQTNQSRIRPYVLLSFEDFLDFNDFINEVDIHLELENARITSSDIEYFAPNIADIHFDTDISGSLTGRVNAISGQRINLIAADNTQLNGNVSIKGLPDIESTIFDVQINRLQTNTDDIEKLVLELSPNPEFALPDLLDRLEALEYKGTFQGLYNNFEVEGLLQTALGDVQTAVSVTFENGPVEYIGDLISNEFDLGTLVSQPLLGHTAFSTFVQGENFQLSNIQLNTDGEIHYLDFMGYRYEDITLKTGLNGNLLSADIVIEDNNLQLSAAGELSLIPDSIYHDFRAYVHQADLHALQLYDAAPLQVHAAQINSQLAGSSLNDLTGSASVHDLQFQLGERTFHVPATELQASGAFDHRELALHSDLLDARLSGQADLNGIWPYLKNMAQQYIPALALNETQTPAQDFQLTVQVHDFEPIAAFIPQKIAISAGSTFDGTFASAGNAHFKAYIPELTYGPVLARQIHLSQRTGLPSSLEPLRLELSAEQVRLYDIQQIATIRVRQQLQNNLLDYEINMQDTLARHQANLSGQVQFRSQQAFDIQTSPSQIILNEEIWQVSKGLISLQNGHAQIDGLDFSNQQQRIHVNGLISGQPNEQLHVQFDNFDLSTLNPFIPGINFELGGRINGRTDITSILNKPYAVADLDINALQMDELRVGNLGIDANFDPERNLVNLAIDLIKDNKQTLFVGGTYHINRTDDNLDLLARFDQTDLDILQVVLKDLIHNVSGTLSGQAQLSGTLQNMDISGAGRLNRVGLTVSYLNTPYRLDGPVTMKNTVFLLDNMELLDPRNRKAQVNGKIDLRHVTNPLIQANIQAENFLVLNTSLRDNPLYYGTAYGTGRFDFSGTPNAMNININARTEESTIFHIPLNASGTLGDSEFIRFVSFNPADEQSNSDPGLTIGGENPADSEKSGFLEGLLMNMDLHVTNGSIVNIHTDLGELSGRGDGQIALRISSLGDFEMFGDYLINSGKFTFTAQDFINKIFELKQGGTIRWTGRPTDATIGLVAFYEQRTSLSPLYDAAGRTTNEQRVIARAEMELNGNLMRPGINFGLDFPADPYVKDELQSYLSDLNNVNQQALSLIVRRSFIPGSNTDLGQELNSTLLSAGTELAFNQLNTIISQSLNLNFIDLNIRSLNDASASLRFFNDRLVFTGGITDLRNQRLNDLNVFSERVATDAELLYLIRKDGRLVLRGSNKLNTRHFLLNPTDEYISALGLIYRQEFDNFGEFFNKLFLIHPRREESGTQEDPSKPEGDDLNKETNDQQQK